MSFSDLMRVLARDARDALSPPQLTDARPPEPLKLRRGGFVEVDTLPFRMAADHTNFELRKCAQPIATRGLIDLNGSYLHRFYLDDDDTWIQVKTDGGVDDANVSECILWQYWDTKTPANHAELRQIAGPESEIGLPRLEIGAFEYQRVSGSRPRDRLSLCHSPNGSSTKPIPHRASAAGTTPCCIAGVSSPPTARSTSSFSVEECPDSLQVVTSIGMDLSPADLSVT